MPLVKKLKLEPWTRDFVWLGLSACIPVIVRMGAGELRIGMAKATTEAEMESASGYFLGRLPLIAGCIDWEVEFGPSGWVCYEILWRRSGDSSCSICIGSCTRYPGVELRD